jgi:hypothetical protein
LYAWNWIEGYKANRPMMSEAWVTVTDTSATCRGLVPMGMPVRSSHGHRLGNDWRIKAN